MLPKLTAGWNVSIVRCVGRLLTRMFHKLIYGYPVTCREGVYRIVPDLEISEFSRAKMQATYQELVEERDSVKHLLG